MPVHFAATLGPKNIPENTNKPSDYLNLFFNDAFIDKTVEETNRYSDQQGYFEEKEFVARHSKLRSHQWIREGHTTRDEMRTSLGVVLNVGVVQNSLFKASGRQCTQP